MSTYSTSDGYFDQNNIKHQEEYADMKHIYKNSFKIR